jgi:CRP/FNR family transcriptional regulator, cyclic AMP receptor protein
MASSVIDPALSSVSSPVTSRRPPIIFPGPARRKQSFAGSHSRTAYGYLNLSREASTELARIRHTISCQTGATVFSEGEPCRGVFILCQGQAKLTIANSDGRTLIVRMVIEGDILALGPCLGGGSHEMTLETTKPSRFAFIRRDDFREWLNNHNDVSRAASEQLIRDCRAAHELVRSIGLSHSTLERVARFLLSRAALSKNTLSLHLTHEEIGQMIGTTRETVTRALAVLRKKRIVGFSGPILTIRNPAALQRLAE